ncbi:MAG: aminotransferase class I/II-fold pyridoxal phosphate-dependent enzyme [Woeseiaceae bacterium]|jgi:aspartate/methionine/tyrosine aminotransferase|nr:aminotransferase class I/II-fold pyridoxal phosphate-dependent enzyme [Woeseiaceae bacterium]|tara:strand:+ start:12755 stop:13876 length:1122 start_codon:yes stop_codon:yes gene_type:complete
MFHQFKIESYLTEHEKNVAYNYSESGVHPLKLGDFLELAGKDLNELANIEMDYPNVRGKIELREKIAALYPNAKISNILTTIGASEANYLTAETLLKPGDEMVALQPAYLQLPGNALNNGITLKTVELIENQNWALNTEQLMATVNASTKIISVINPHNPTGHILEQAEMDAIIKAASSVGAWIVADEVYAGTERGDTKPTRSFWGQYDRVIAINSMSKAYGMPGLRIGWIVAPEELIPEFQLRHEYTTISSTMLGNELANIALDPEVRPKLTQRARELINFGFDTLTDMLSVHGDTYKVVPPQASAMCVVRYDLPIDSLAFVDRLVHEKSTLVVPGSCFGLDQHFRCSSALPETYLREGLHNINELVSDIKG